MHIHIPVSPGELIDKITILEIKLIKITDLKKVQNVKNELMLLYEVMHKEIKESDTLTQLHSELRATNESIWNTENIVREFWNDDTRCLAAARETHYNNDQRARIKKEINTLLNSSIMEEKSHPSYEYKSQKSSL